VKFRIFGHIGRRKNNYQYWTTEYIYTNGRPTRSGGGVPGLDKKL
jgi:hypothetical protein